MQLNQRELVLARSFSAWYADIMDPLRLPTIELATSGLASWGSARRIAPDIIGRSSRALKEISRPSREFESSDCGLLPDEAFLASYLVCLQEVLCCQAYDHFRKGASMFRVCRSEPHIMLTLLTFAGAMLPLTANAASCKTQSQMTAAERDALSSAARTIVGEIQSGNVQALQRNTIPAVAANFSGIAGSIESLKPLVQQAAITIDSIYELNAPSDTAKVARTDFYCGTPVVVLNFTDLPSGTYALVILHATGVPKPQQISLILSEEAEHHWMLGGFFSRPMIYADHDGLWYWVSARKYAQRNMNWNAWFYYRIAAYCLNPVEFLSSPNLEKLKHEQDRVHPSGIPGPDSLMLTTHGSTYQVTSIDTTIVFGPLDLEVHYIPDAAQIAQLRDPPTARKQVTEVMLALLALHPELQDAFHGIWVQADHGSAPVFSLELPMEQIALGTRPPAPTSSSIVQ